jgi:hypothetical protein
VEETYQFAAFVGWDVKLPKDFLALGCILCPHIPSKKL